jgi:hypothetical protein
VQASLQPLPTDGGFQAKAIDMKMRWSFCGVVISAMLAGPVGATTHMPLRMDLAPIARAQNAAPLAPPAQGYRANRTFNAPHQAGARDPRDARLTRADAVGTLGVGLLTGLDPADATVATQPEAGYPELKFQKRGHLARDIKRGYREMGENLARRVWEDPRGKRIVFDVAGKPGVGVEIQLGRH